jgi:hypothetical protein
MASSKKYESEWKHGRDICYAVIWMIVHRLQSKTMQTATCWKSSVSATRTAVVIWVVRTWCWCCWVPTRQVFRGAVTCNGGCVQDDKKSTKFKYECRFLIQALKDADKDGDSKITFEGECRTGRKVVITIFFRIQSLYRQGSRTVIDCHTNAKFIHFLSVILIYFWLKQGEILELMLSQ